MAINLRSGELIQTPKRKFTLISVSKDEERETYEFEKKQEFFPSLFEILLRLGFNENSIYLQYYFGIPHDNDEITAEEYYKDPFSKGYLNISQFNEVLETIKNEKYDIEVIIFSDRIFLIIRKKAKDKINIGNLLTKYSLFRNERE
jgi:hypothetical protein